MGLWDDVEKSEESSFGQSFSHTMSNIEQDSFIEGVAREVSKCDRKDKLFELFIKGSGISNSENRYLLNPILGMKLISKFLSSSNKKGELENLFQEFDNYINSDFIKMSNTIEIKNQTTIYNKLLAIRDELYEDVKFNELIGKSIVGIGGSFSAGKSSFLNAILNSQKDILPVETRPTTSIPTYIIQDIRDMIFSFNREGNKTEIDREAFQAISHEFNDIYGFGLVSIIKNIVVYSKDMPYENIAFLDTPGYSKSDGDKQIDRKIAKEYLENLDALIWLIDSDNGTIRQSDIEFLNELDIKDNLSILFVINKADRKPESELKQIISKMEIDIRNNFKYKFDITAYSSHNKKEYFNQNKINTFLKRIDNTLATNNLYSRLLDIFDEYDVHLQEEQINSKKLLGIFNNLDTIGYSIVSKIENYEYLKRNIKDRLSRNKKEIILYEEISKKGIKLLSNILDKLIYNKDIFREQAEKYGKEGKRLYDNEDYQKAIDCYTKAIELNPTYAFYWYARGKSYHNLKDFHEAINNFTKAIELYPDYADHWFYRGDSYFWLEDYHKAISNYTKAIELDSDVAFYWYVRGKSYHNFEDYQKAISDFTKAIELYPDYADHWFYRGDSYFWLEDYHKAISNYTKAIGLDSDVAFYWYVRGKSYHNFEDYQKAISDFTKAIELYPDYADHWFYRGESYFAIADFHKAISDFTKAIELNSNNATYWYVRGDGYFCLEDYNKAINDYTKSIELDSNVATYWYLRGRSYHNLEDYQKAISDITKAIELDSSNDDHWFYRGESYFAIADFHKAISDFTKAIELNSNNATYWYVRGDGYFYLEDYQKAIKDYTKAIELDSNVATYWYVRGKSYFKLKDLHKAISDITKAIELDSSNDDYWFYRGDSYFWLEDYQKAIKDLTKAIELDSNNAFYWYVRGAGYASLKDYQKAIKDYTKAIELDSDVALYLGARGNSYEAIGEYSKAQKDFDRAKKLS